MSTLSRFARRSTSLALGEAQSEVIEFLVLPVNASTANVASQHNCHARVAASSHFPVTGPIETNYVFKGD
jgi:hypothetical protein